MVGIVTFLSLRAQQVLALQQLPPACLLCECARIASPISWSGVLIANTPKMILSQFKISLEHPKSIQLLTQIVSSESSQGVVRAFCNACGSNAGGRHSPTNIRPLKEGTYWVCPGVPRQRQSGDTIKPTSAAALSSSSISSTSRAMRAQL